MSLPVEIVGIGARGLEDTTPAGRAAVARANLIAGGRRHLALLGPVQAELFAVTADLDALADRLARRGPGERCVVLATGDPLFFGVADFLGRRLGADQIRVEPWVSSLQLLFARAGMPWHDASIASVHGRDLKATLLPLLGRPKIGLFTHDGGSPAAIAGFFAGRDLADYEAWVGERLGTENEAVTRADLPDLVGRRFADLNVLLLRRKGEATIDHGPAGLPDDRFDQPASGPVLLTHADVRAVTLARFRGLPEGPIWDLGAGLGGVSVELARAFPDREVVAIERDAGRLPYLRSNRLRFGSYNLTVVEADAPASLPDEPPAGIFLGGSGGRLDEILGAVVARLRPGGVFVANFVGLENLSTTLGWARSVGWPAEVVQVQVSRGEPLAGLTCFAPLRPVWIVAARRPVESDR